MAATRTWPGHLPNEDRELAAPEPANLSGGRHRTGHVEALRVPLLHRSGRGRNQREGTVPLVFQRGIVHPATPGAVSRRLVTLSF